MKEKESPSPKYVIFCLVFAFVWQIYLIIRFLTGNTGSILYLVHVALAIILDIRVAEAWMKHRKHEKKTVQVPAEPYILTEADKKWNKMWDLWVWDEVDSPYRELMTYSGEVNNGGHGQYFDNVGNSRDLQKEMMALETILPPKLRENLKKAYEIHLRFEAGAADDDMDGEASNQCDMMFYENEQEVNQILQTYANTLEL